MADKEHPLVSIVVPVRNGRAWIGATLESISAQTVEHDCFELILVDDGSSDGTVDFCREFLGCEHFVWKLLTSGGRGVSAARNLGIANAKAEWIQLLDADDLIHKSKLETQLSVAKTAENDIAVIASPWARFSLSESGVARLGDTFQPAFDDWATLTLVRADGFLPIGAYLLRKNWWGAVAGFDEERTHVEDVDFLLRVADGGGRFIATRSASPMFFYRVRRDSVSHTSAEKIIEGTVLNANGVRARAAAANRLNTQLTQLLLEVYSQGLRYWFEHDRKRFRDLYRHVLELEPDYHPKAPRILAAFSRLLGYPIAERLALAYRRMKSIARLDA